MKCPEYIKNYIYVNNNKANFKMGKGREYIVLQRGCTNGQWAYEKVLIITNHYVDANQNHNKISVDTH